MWGTAVETAVSEAMRSAPRDDHGVAARQWASVALQKYLTVDPDSSAEEQSTGGRFADPAARFG